MKHAANGPNRQLYSVSVFHERHMMGGNPLYLVKYLDGLADDVAAMTRLTITLTGFWRRPEGGNISKHNAFHSAERKISLNTLE